MKNVDRITKSEWVTKVEKMTYVWYDEKSNKGIMLVATDSCNMVKLHNPASKLVIHLIVRQKHNLARANVNCGLDCKRHTLD